MSNRTRKRLTSSEREHAEKQAKIERYNKKRIKESKQALVIIAILITLLVIYLVLSQRWFR